MQSNNFQRNTSLLDHVSSFQSMDSPKHEHTCINEMFSRFSQNFIMDYTDTMGSNSVETFIDSFGF